MNTTAIKYIERFLKLANHDDYSRHHAAKLIEKLGGIDLLQVHDMVKNLEYITSKKDKYAEED